MNSYIKFDYRKQHNKIKMCFEFKDENSSEKSETVIDLRGLQRNKLVLVTQPLFDNHIYKNLDFSNKLTQIKASIFLE